MTMFGFISKVPRVSLRFCEMLKAVSGVKISRLQKLTWRHTNFVRRKVNFRPQRCDSSQRQSRVPSMLGILIWQRLGCSVGLVKVDTATRQHLRRVVRGTFSRGAPKNDGICFYAAIITDHPLLL